MSGRRLDLDKARAARAELDREPPIVVYGGKEFVLPAELPVDFAFLFKSGDLRGALVAMFGDQAEEFFVMRPSMDDVAELGEGMSELYGLRLPESSASLASSTTSGNGSRPTSNGSTDSTPDASSAIPGPDES